MAEAGKVEAANDLMKEGEKKLDGVMKEKKTGQKGYLTSHMMIETASAKNTASLKELASNAS